MKNREIQRGKKDIHSQTRICFPSLEWCKKHNKGHIAGGCWWRYSRTNGYSLRRIHGKKTRTYRKSRIFKSIFINFSHACYYTENNIENIINDVIIHELIHFYGDKEFSHKQVYRASLSMMKNNKCYEFMRWKFRKYIM